MYFMVCTFAVYVGDHDRPKLDLFAVKFAWTFGDWGLV